jgi:hypothetical protein
MWIARGWFQSEICLTVFHIKSLNFCQNADILGATTFGVLQTFRHQCFFLFFFKTVSYGIYRMSHVKCAELEIICPTDSRDTRSFFECAKTYETPCMYKLSSHSHSHFMLHIIRRNYSSNTRYMKLQDKISLMHISSPISCSSSCVSCCHRLHLCLT